MITFGEKQVRQDKFIVHGTITAEHQWLIHIHYRRSDTYVIQAFYNHPKPEYIDTLAEAGCKINIIKINRWTTK